MSCFFTGLACLAVGGLSVGGYLLNKMGFFDDKGWIDPD